MRHNNLKHLAFFFRVFLLTELLWNSFLFILMGGTLGNVTKTIYLDLFPFWLECEASEFCRLYVSKGKYLVVEDNHGILCAASFTLVGRILWICWIISLNSFTDNIFWWQFPLQPSSRIFLFSLFRKEKKPEFFKKTENLSICVRVCACTHTVQHKIITHNIQAKNQHKVSWNSSLLCIYCWPSKLQNW